MKIQSIFPRLLTYTINFTYRITESYYPNGYALEAWGDLTGNGRWTLE
jgi:hypothetical protein